MRQWIRALPVSVATTALAYLVRGDVGGRGGSLLSRQPRFADLPVGLAARAPDGPADSAET